MIDEEPIDAYVEMMTWNGVWLKAIAQSWRDPDFKKQLLDDAPAALAKFFGYRLPANLSLKVVETKEGPEYGYHVHGSDSWILPPNELTMILPPRPDRAVTAEQIEQHTRNRAVHVEDFPVALIDYMNSGRVYPFTSF